MENKLERENSPRRRGRRFSTAGKKMRRKPPGGIPGRLAPWRNKSG